MEWASKDLVGVIYHLMPGFIAAWIFFSLTAHQKPDAFERVVQALIFTVLAQLVVIPLRELLFVIGQGFSIGVWNNEGALALSVLVAVVLGVAFSWWANTDRGYRWLRDRGLTKRTSFPSEWYSAFHRKPRKIVLHLKGGRRLYGWPEEWPDQPDKGHFLIVQAAWLLDDGREAHLHDVSKVLVPGLDVELVELMKSDDEDHAGPEDKEHAKNLLLDLQKKELATNGRKTTTTSPDFADRLRL